MNWINGLMPAFLTLALPVGVLTFIMVWWSLRQGILGQDDDFDLLSAELNSMSKTHKKNKKPRINPVHDKWLKLGGGFYGIVGMYTLIRVEWSEVVDFVGSIGDLVLRLDISVLISFFINSLMNFITAIAWPAYWVSQARGTQIWVWFVLAYAGYWVGLRLAFKARGQSLPTFEEKLQRMQGFFSRDKNNKDDKNTDI